MFIRKLVHGPIILPLVAFVFALLFWVIDSVIDYFLFEEGNSFLDSFFMPEPMDFWMRCLVVFLMGVFSVYARHLLVEQIKLTDELEKLKNELEDIVEERTKALHEKQKELEILSITDPLTEIYNRRKFHEILSTEIEREKRYKAGLALLFIDIDHFKSTNDRFGHDVGDKVIVMISKLLSESVRVTDTVARWGGEEFVCLVNSPDENITLKIAEKLRGIIEKTEFIPGEIITISVGVSMFHAGDSAESLIKRADDALYQAKNKGRNRVVFAA